MLTLDDGGGDLLLLTWTATGSDLHPTEHAEEAYTALDAALTAQNAFPLQERAFAQLRAVPCLVKGRARAVGSRERWAVPPTYVEGAPATDESFAGIHVLAARGESSHLVRERGHVLGRVVNTASARMLGLGDVGRSTAGHLPNGRLEDAAASIAATVTLLDREGLSVRDVTRTWFYLRDILDWYGGFNAVRNAAFRELGLVGANGNGKLPASTGIGGRNPRGGWCTLDLIASRGRDGEAFSMERLHSRRQNEATEYGSAFARGMALTLGACRYIFVSGTASIDDRGATVHVGDFDAQMEQTLGAMSAVLEDAGAGLGDLEQATSFLKNPEHRRSYERLMRRAGLSELPALTTVADVCRDDLLFEMDATAVVPVNGSRTRL